MDKMRALGITLNVALVLGIPVAAVALNVPGELARYQQESTALFGDGSIDDRMDGQMRNGSQVPAEVVDVAAEAVEVAALTEGMECWDPSTGRLASQIVVRDSETSEVSVIPFTAEAYERATAGEFVTLRACEAS